jgi:subtilisin family serine protease
MQIKRNIIKLFLILFTILISYSVYAQEIADTKYWIIFKDKGSYKPDMQITSGSDAYNAGINLLSDRAIKRRLKVLSDDKLVDFQDLPLENSYVTGVSNLGVTLIAKSKWLNGVSAYLTPSQVKQVLGLSFVKGLKLVKKLITQNNNFTEPIYNKFYKPLSLFTPEIDNDLLKYGNSLKQDKMVNVPKVHNLGINGQGVLFASFDDGFEWRSHEALKDLKIIDEYDFINEDNNTGKEENQKYKDSPQQGMHGTATLSAACGYKEGKLIGPSFGAEIILAKTEYTATETPMEEDFWMEAAEWAEAKGVDVITSSLGYKKWDDPFASNSYVYGDYDGRTTIVSIAASRSAYLGVLVCNSIGNYNQTNEPSIANGDADSIIAVGAVDYNGNIASFSSNGPSSDGRIKPDFVGPGVQVYSALDSKFVKNDSSYIGMNGTSLSCPIVAGVCALVLSAHPELTPMEVINALRKTSSLANNPNNVYGYGIVNAYDAILSFGFIWGKYFSSSVLGNDLVIKTRFASNKPIDINIAKCIYSISGGKSKEVKLDLTKINEPTDNAFEGSAVLKGVKDLNSVTYYFVVKETDGNEYYSNK